MLSNNCGKIVCLLLLLFSGLTGSARSVELNGNWSYFQAGGDDRETVSTFQQRYQLGVGPQLTLTPTDAITVSGGIGYRNTQRDTGNGRESVEQLNPFGQVSLVNDIFIASVAANSFTTMSGSDFSTAFWNANLFSAWDMPFWPSLSWSYSEDFAGVDKATLFDDSRGKTTNTTYTVDWDLQLAELYYEHSVNELVDNFGDVTNEATTDYVRLKTGGYFWDDRIGFNLTQQYRTTTNEFKVGEDTGEVSELSRITLVPQTAGSFVESLVTAPDPEDVVLNNNFGLRDNDLTTVVETVTPNDLGSFGLSFNNATQIDAVTLFLDPLSGFTAGQALLMSWDLYVRNALTSEWELLSSNIPFDYNNIGGEKRFDFLIDLFEQEFMLVTENPVAGGTLPVTELRAYRFITEDGENEETRYLTNLGVNYRILDQLSAVFTLTYDRYESEGNASDGYENDKLNWNGKLQWSPSQYFSPSIGYSEYRETQTDQDDELNRLYSVNLSSRPLRVLSLALGATRNERFEDDEKYYTSDVFSIFAQAAIYPDLTARLNTSYSITDTLVTDTSGVNEWVNNKTFSTRLDITAKLRPKLTVFLNSDFSKTDDEATGKSEYATSILSANYRPSDLLSFQAGYRAFFLDSDRTNVLNASMEVYLLRTDKSRLSLRAQHIDADETIDNISMIGSWDISDYFSLSTNGNYTMGPRDFYSFNASLSFRM